MMDDRMSESKSTAPVSGHATACAPVISTSEPHMNGASLL
jgi:hypothetical protein